MSQVGKTTLKGYFNAGDVPTESNFADLVDSCHNGQGGTQIASHATLTDLSSDTAGGRIIITAPETDSAQSVIKLPAASTANIGLNYKVVVASNPVQLRVGPDGTTTMLTGSVSVISDAGDDTIIASQAVGDTHISLSAANNAGDAGCSGSFLEFDYITATGVVVNGTLIATHDDPTGVTIFGSGDIG